MLENLRQYIGIPYRHHGRDRITGMDCYGVISHIYQKEKSITPNDFPYDPVVSIKDVVNIPITEAGWVRVPPEDIQPFDIIVFKNLRYIGQVGMYIGNNKFIHTSKRTGSIISPLNVERKRRIIGVYRWAG